MTDTPNFRTEVMRQADHTIQNGFVMTFGQLISSGKYDDVKAGDLPMDIMEEWFVKGWEASDALSRSARAMG